MITVQMATYPARMQILPLAINSLLPQVDAINVMLNNYTTEQLGYLMRLWYDSLDMTVNPKIRFILRNNEMTDGEKFYGVEHLEGYILTCDDDLMYPEDYVKKSIEKIEEYGRKCVITYHGRVWNDHPITSFYRDRKEMYQCIEGFEGDHVVDCGGDGVMAWHSDTFKMRYNYVELPDMSQLWIALKCNEDNVKQIAVGHPAGWIRDISLDLEDSIWFKCNEDDSMQTKLVNTRWIVR